MTELAINRILIPTMTLRRVGVPVGDAMQQHDKPNVEGLTPGSEEYLEAVVRATLFSSLWHTPISQFNHIGLELYLQTLFSQSCSEVLIAAPSDDIYKEATAELPALVKRRISFASPTNANSYELVKAYLLPIAKEIAELAKPDEESSSVGPGELVVRNSRHNSSPLTSVAQELYLLACAAAHKASVDIDANFFVEKLNQVRALPLSTDAQFRLSMIQGLLNLYAPHPIEGLAISEKYKGESIAERLFELLNDSAYLDLSHERFSLGTRSQRGAAIRRISSIVRSIAGSKKWKGMLKVVKSSVDLVLPIKLPSLSGLEDVVALPSYSPSLTSLDGLKIREFMHVDQDKEALLQSLRAISFTVDNDFIDSRVNAGTLSMEWTYFSDEQFPDFSFKDTLAPSAAA